MKLPKFLRKIKCDSVIIVLAVVFIAYAVMNYNSKFTLFSEKYTEKKSNGQNPSKAASNVGYLQTLGQNAVHYRDDNNLSGQDTNAQTSIHGLPPSCVRQKVVNPADLLPKDKNSQWAKLNPMGGGDLKGVNLLQAGVHQGIDTVGQSLRNANLQLRSEPANPIMKVGPWNNSTIEPDLARRPLEIGCDGKNGGR